MEASGAPSAESRSIATAHAARIEKIAERISVSNIRSTTAFIRISHSSFWVTTSKGCLRGWLKS
jgi:hypothetical protein